MRTGTVKFHAERKSPKTCKISHFSPIFGRGLCRCNLWVDISIRPCALNSGGDGGTYASVGGSTGGTGASVGVTDNSGSLIGVQQADGSTAATVNLGSALNGFLTDPGPRTINLNNALNGVGPLNSPAERVRGAFLSLSYAQRRQVRRTCVEVFAHPGSFDRDTRILCSLIARL